MSDNKTSLVKKELETIRGVQIKAQEKILIELEKNDELMEKFNVECVSGGDEYPNYHWIELTKKDETKKFLICMFLNDVDPSTGNVHSIYGKVQFAKVNQEKGSFTSPNEIYDGKWRFSPENTYPDYKTKKEALDVEDDNIGEKAVILFLTWYEKIEKKTKGNINVRYEQKIKDKFIENIDDVNRNMTVRCATCRIGRIQEYAQDKILKALKNEDEIIEEFSKISGRSGHRDFYSNYVWIQLTHKGSGQGYLISMTAYDLNPVTGQTYSRYGSIQFIKLQKYKEKFTSPNENIKDVGWRLCPENTYPDFQSKNRALSVEDENIGIKTVDAFLNWYK